MLSFGTYYWYGRGSDVLAETDLSGVWKRVYICLNGSQVARHDPGSNWFCYFADHLGSSRVVTNATGTILDDSDFYPFGGERAVASGAGSSAGTPQGVRHPFGGERAVASGSGNAYKFTGKERDSETGLDYFIARYYASAYGRFTSTDPKGIALRHLLNPQKLNKYSYVLNNPLNLFDPNGMEEVTITFRTFIPQKSVTIAGLIFAGDNRGFSTSPNASSRTFITVRLETDASKRANPIISVTSGAGATHQLDAKGNVVKTGIATTGLPTATATRDASGNVVLNIKQAVKNPLTPQALTPAIDANLTVIVPPDASSVNVKGTIDDFPAAELNVTRADGTTTPVLQLPTKTPFSLFLPPKDVSVEKPTPQCSKDDKGEKVCSP